MVGKIKDHLIRCEKAMQTAKGILGRHAYPDDYRTVTVIGFISITIEHQESLLLLTDIGMTGSAFALCRPAVEGAYRGLWINLPATDEQITKFNQKDDIDLTFAEIAEAIDNAYATQGLFIGLKKRAWSVFNSFAHCGALQIGRRFTKHEVLNDYSDGEIYEMTTIITTCALLLLSLFLKRQSQADSGKEVDALLSTFGPVADGTKQLTK